MKDSLQHTKRGWKTPAEETWVCDKGHKVTYTPSLQEPPFITIGVFDYPQSPKFCWQCIVEFLTDNISAMQKEV